MQDVTATAARPPLLDDAPLLAPCGRLAPLVARLVRARPTLAARLLVAPRRAIHAAGAYIQARGDREDEPDFEHLACEIEARDPRHLLHLALGGTHPRLYRLLDRCGSAVQPLPFYRDLLDLLRGPLADAVLGARDIFPGTLRLLREAEADPVLSAAAHTLLADPTSMGNLRAVLEFLRGSGVAREIEQLPKGAGRRAIVRRIEADLARARPPEPPFPAPDGWRHLRDVGDVLQAGRGMKNCLSQIASGSAYLSMFLTGSVVLLRPAGLRHGVAAVAIVGPRLWQVTEIHVDGESSERRAMHEAFLGCLRRTLEGAGHRLVAMDPLHAFRALSEADGGFALGMAED